MEKFAGIDWASAEHALCVVDETGSRLRERRVSHEEPEITALCRELVALGVRRVGIERPDGILVDRLLETGIEVIAVHPNQAKAARERYSVARGKSDRFDAFVLAELARTDSHRLRAIRPASDETKALRALVRTREGLVGARVELANQLRAQLQAFWPGALVFYEVDTPISLAFLGATRVRPTRRGSDPSALGLSSLATATPAAKRRRICWRRCEALRPGAPASSRSRHGERWCLAWSAPWSRSWPRSPRSPPRSAAPLPSTPTRRSSSLFRDVKTVICPAALIAELGDSRERYPTDTALAADAGMSPVAVESGKRRSATFRRACDKRLRNAVANLADSTRHWHPWARDVYRRARARGQDHPHAIRTLGRAWIRVLWRCWQDGVPYDPALHGNPHRLQTVGG